MEKLSQSLQKGWENSWVIIHTHPVSEAFQVLASDWLKILLGQSEDRKFTSFSNCFCKNQYNLFRGFPIFCKLYLLWFRLRIFQSD